MKAAGNSETGKISPEEKVEKKLSSLLLQAPVAIAILEGPDHIFTFANPPYEKLFGRSREQLVGHTVREVFPEVSDQGIHELFDQVYNSGQVFAASEYPAVFIGSGKQTVAGYYNFIIQPIFDEAGVVTDVMVNAYEVTSQVIAHKKVEESERQLQLMADAMPLLISYVDRELRYRFNNHAYEKWFGKTKNEIHGRKMVDVLGEKAFASIKPKIEQALSGTPVQFEGTLAYKDGGHRYVTADYIPHFADDKTVTGLYVVVNDLTERKQAEERLAESEIRFRNLIESNIIGVIFWDIDRGILNANDAFLRRFGYTRNDIASGLNWIDITPPEWAEKDRESTESILKTGHHVPFEKQYLHKDGTKVDVIIGSTAFQGTNNRQGVTFVLDISEQKRTEAQLRENIEAQRAAQATLAYRTALLEAHQQASIDGILLVDTKGRVISYNNRFLEIWNMPAEFLEQDEQVSLEHAKHQLAEPEKFVERVKWLYEHLGQSSLDELYFKDGRVLERHGYPVIGSDGTFYAWSWTFRDITRQKKFAEQLENVVNERTRELQQSNNDLQQFAHVASHDLKEPVRKVKTFIGRLHEEYADKFDQRGKGYLEKIQHATDRMVSMIEGVLNYSTLGSSIQRSEDVNLNDVFVQIETDLEVVIQDTGTRIHRNDIPRIEGASVLLYQLFYNLINNSIKFARPGVSPEILVEARIHAVNGKEMVEIRVRDNGIGFEQQHADVIFETFTRLNSKDKYEGTGLGLALARKIVERHGGTIRAIGSKERGAEFIINLPCHQNQHEI